MNSFENVFLVHLFDKMTPFLYNFSLNRLDTSFNSFFVKGLVVYSVGYIDRKVCYSFVTNGIVTHATAV